MKPKFKRSYSDADFLLIARMPEWQKQPLADQFAAVVSRWRATGLCYKTKKEVMQMFEDAGVENPRSLVKTLIRQGILGVK